MAPNSEISNPNENLIIPEWINEEYFKKVIEKDEPNYVKIVKFSPVAATPPGENYTSIMLRAHFDLEMKDGSIKSKSYILKTMLDDERGGHMIKEFGLFPKEMKMYHQYLPAYEELYKAAGKDIQLAPKCLLAESVDGRINFIFEDLKSKKFVNTDRITGLDMPHMKRVLEKLAEYHAATVVYAEQNGPYPEEFDEGFATKKGEEMQRTMFLIKQAAFIKSMDTWGMENAEHYIKKFPNVEQHIKCSKSSLYTDPNEFNVLIHGDFWSSNMMLNYHPDGAINELLLVDFQICKWGSPAQDLLFFLTLSPATDIRIKEFDHFVEIYHSHLVECLKLLKCQRKIPTLRDIHISMYKNENTFYAWFAVYNHLAHLQFPSDKDSNLSSMMASDEAAEQFRYRVFSNPAFGNIMKDLFPFFCHRGLFNFSDYE